MLFPVEYTREVYESQLLKKQFRFSHYRNRNHTNFFRDAIEKRYWTHQGIFKPYFSSGNKLSMGKKVQP